jgi:hypothetical protein
MNAAELTAALSTVEQDHRLLLEKMRVLKKAVGCLLGPREVPLRRILGRLRDSNDYFATQFESHLEGEERELFPLLEREPDGPALVGRLRRDHAEIRRLRAEFGNCLAVALETEDAPARMVLRDVLAFGWELWGLLDDHARAETQAVREAAARSLQDVSP